MRSMAKLLLYIQVSDATLWGGDIWAKLWKVWRSELCVSGGEHARQRKELARGPEAEEGHVGHSKKKSMEGQMEWGGRRGGNPWGLEDSALGRCACWSAWVGQHPDRTWAAQGWLGCCVGMRLQGHRWQQGQQLGGCCKNPESDEVMMTKSVQALGIVRENHQDFLGGWCGRWEEERSPKFGDGKLPLLERGKRRVEVVWERRQVRSSVWDVQSVRCLMAIQMEMPSGQFIYNLTQAWERGKSQQRHTVGLSHLEVTKSPGPSPEHDNTWEKNHKHHTANKKNVRYNKWSNSSKCGKPCWDVLLHKLMACLFLDMGKQYL